MNTIIFETKDILNFESPDWKKISTDPEIFETLRDDIILKFVNYAEAPGISSAETNELITLKFKKGIKVKVSKVRDKTFLNCRYTFSVNELFELIKNDDPKP